MSTSNLVYPFISRCVHIVILTAAWALVLHSVTARAQVSGSIMVVEKHPGGATVYYLRNGGQVDATVTISFTSLSSGQRITSKLQVAAQTFSAPMATSDDSTKPVIMSVQYSLPPSGDSLQPAATP